MKAPSLLLCAVSVNYLGRLTEADRCGTCGGLPLDGGDMGLSVLVGVEGDGWVG